MDETAHEAGRNPSERQGHVTNQGARLARTPQQREANAKMEGGRCLSNHSGCPHKTATGRFRVERCPHTRAPNLVLDFEADFLFEI